MLIFSCILFCFYSRNINGKGYYTLAIINAITHITGEVDKVYFNIGGMRNVLFGHNLLHLLFSQCTQYTHGLMINDQFNRF